MPLKEISMFGTIDLVAEAIREIKAHEPAAGYKVAFSGGKDSVVLADLFKKSGVKHRLVFNLTTVDPPELLAFIKEYYPQVERIPPRISMYGLIVRNLMPPTRRIRFCCKYLKERADKCEVGITALGIRAEESDQRANRKAFEESNFKKGLFYLSPILNWTSRQIWEYHKENNLPHCCLYDEGAKRIGCICCPMRQAKGMEEDARRWPRHAGIYMAAFAEVIKRIRASGRKYSGKHKWNSAQDIWDWWLYHDKKDKCDKYDPAFFFEN